MRLKLCITFVLLLIAAVCLSLIVLIIPLIVIPSLTQERVEYYSDPGICSLHELRVIRSWKKCRASHSCRDDCEIIPKRCVRMFVDYRLHQQNSSALQNATWNSIYVPLMLNPRACGDPGGMDCQTFENLYQIGNEFPCHRSIREPLHTVLELSWGDDEMYPLALSLGLPLSLTFIFLAVGLMLCFWYCRGSPGYRKEDLDVETERKCAFE